MIWLYATFISFILLLLAVDLGVFHRRSHEVSVRESLVWCAVWAALAMSFGVLVFFLYEYHLFGINGAGGRDAALVYLTGYLVEESLSMDNMFVIAMILAYFGVPAIYQHRVLFWGILGALILRGIMIGAGVALVSRFNWILYFFGALLILSAIRMARGGEEKDPRNNLIVRLARRILPVTEDFHGKRFIIRRPSRGWALTPLALALLTVESADVIFAVDSIPAIFAITNDPFLIFTSNVFAILGLRSLFFALAGIMAKFRYVKVSLVVLLTLIGMKLLLKDVLHDIPHLTFYMLGSVIAILSAGVIASLVAGPQKDAQMKPDKTG